MKTETITHFIQNRRAIYPKMFSGEVIADEQIEELLASANWAPSHKHTEPWRFMVFSGEGLRRLAEFQASLYKTKHEKEASYSESKYQKLLTKPVMCSHIIAVSAKNSGVGLTKKTSARPPVRCKTYG